MNIRTKLGRLLYPTVMLLAILTVACASDPTTAPNPPATSVPVPAPTEASAPATQAPPAATLAPSPTEAAPDPTAMPQTSAPIPEATMPPAMVPTTEGDPVSADAVVSILLNEQNGFWITAKSS